MKRRVAATAFVIVLLGVVTAVGGEWMPPSVTAATEFFMSDAPKSAIDIVMERLRQKDAAAGTEQKSLSDAQRAAIAEARNVYDAQVAERKIMHRSTIASVFDPAELDERNNELRRDLDRFERERDEKIKRIRESS
jgi:hypothetical protein